VLPLTYYHEPLAAQFVTGSIIDNFRFLFFRLRFFLRFEPSASAEGPLELKMGPLCPELDCGASTREDVRDKSAFNDDGILDPWFGGRDRDIIATTEKEMRKKKRRSAEAIHEFGGFSLIAPALLSSSSSSEACFSSLDSSLARFFSALPTKRPLRRAVSRARLIASGMEAPTPNL
jgi:hypothetical protein